MTEPTLSAYVLRCQQAMAKYQHLRFLGVGHEMARKESGFEAAVMGKPDPLEAVKDVRKIMAGDEAI